MVHPVDAYFLKALGWIVSLL